MDGPKLKPPQLETAAVDDDDREPAKVEIMEDIRQGLREIKAGFEGQDAMDFLDELERESIVDAEDC